MSQIQRSHLREKVPKGCREDGLPCFHQPSSSTHIGTLLHSLLARAFITHVVSITYKVIPISRSHISSNTLRITALNSMGPRTPPRGVPSLKNLRFSAERTSSTDTFISKCKRDRDTLHTQVRSFQFAISNAAFRSRNIICIPECDFARYSAVLAVMFWEKPKSEPLGGITLSAYNQSISQLEIILRSTLHDSDPNSLTGSEDPRVNNQITRLPR